MWIRQAQAVQLAVFLHASGWNPPIPWNPPPLLPSLQKLARACATLESPFAAEPSAPPRAFLGLWIRIVGPRLFVSAPYLVRSRPGVTRLFTSTRSPECDPLHVCLSPDHAGGGCLPTNNVHKKAELPPIFYCIVLLLSFLILYFLQMF